MGRGGCRSGRNPRCSAGPCRPGCSAALLSQARPTERSGYSLVLQGMRPIGTAEELERRRRRAVELVKQGEPPAKVAHFLGCGRSSVYTWVKLDRDAAEKLAAKPHAGPKPRSDRRAGQGAGGAAAEGGQGPRLAQRAVERPPGRRGDPPPLRRRLPRRARPQGDPAAAALEQPEAAEEGQAAQRREDRPLKGRGAAPDHQGGRGPQGPPGLPRRVGLPADPGGPPHLRPAGQDADPGGVAPQGADLGHQRRDRQPGAAAARPLLPPAGRRHQRPRRGHGGVPGPAAGPRSRGR